MKTLLADEKILDYEAVLSHVVCVSEAAHKWCVTPRTVVFWIEAGFVVGRKSGGTWLVSYQSLVDFRGQPIR